MITIRRRCSISAMPAPFTNAMTYLLTYSNHSSLTVDADGYVLAGFDPGTAAAALRGAVVPENDGRRDAGTSAASQRQAVTDVDDAAMRKLRQRLQLYNTARQRSN